MEVTTPAVWHQWCGESWIRSLPRSHQHKVNADPVCCCARVTAAWPVPWKNHVLCPQHYWLKPHLWAKNLGSDHHQPVWLWNICNQTPHNHTPARPETKQRCQSTIGLQLALPFLMNINGSFILDFKESVTEANIPHSQASWASEKTISSPGGQLVWLNRQLTSLSRRGVTAQPSTSQQWPCKCQRNKIKYKKEGREIILNDPIR